MAQLELQLDGELREADENAEYQAFVDKFKPKKTTDDCYTPPPVYDAVADWVAGEYKFDKRSFVRPFYRRAATDRKIDFWGRVAFIRESRESRESREILATVGTGAVYCV